MHQCPCFPKGREEGLKFLPLFYPVILAGVILFDSAGDVRLVLNALASSNRATILSSPRILARNGENAVIQVDRDVLLPEVTVVCPILVLNPVCRTFRR